MGGRCGRIGEDGECEVVIVRVLHSKKKIDFIITVVYNRQEKNGGIMQEYRDETAGIYLRPMEDYDTDRIVSWRNKDVVRKNFIYQELFTPESHRKWLKTKIRTGQAVQMIICECGSDRALGSVYIRDIDRVHQKAEYGIFIGEDDARGRGIGTAAARLMIAYSFEKEGLHRLFLRAYADNLQAIRSYEKAGFRKEACLREDVCIDGQFRDMVLMGILSTDPEAKRIMAETMEKTEGI